MSKTLFLFTLCVALFANTYAQDGSVASDAASGLDTPENLQKISDAM
jgi:hypothetical protein